MYEWMQLILQEILCIYPCVDSCFCEEGALAKAYKTGKFSIKNPGTPLTYTIRNVTGNPTDYDVYLSTSSGGYIDHNRVKLEKVGATSWKLTHAGWIDSNGTVYFALIKKTNPNSGVLINKTGSGKTQLTGGQYFLYATPGTGCTYLTCTMVCKASVRLYTNNSQFQMRHLNGPSQTVKWAIIKNTSFLRSAAEIPLL